MPRKDLTRRSLLLALAGAGAAGTAGPGRALGALARARAGAPAPAEPELFAMRLGSLAGRAPVSITAPRRFELAGVQWSGGRTAKIELRTMRPDGSWGAWAQASCTGHGPDGAEAARAAGGAQSTIGDPVWVGLARVIQLRSSLALSDVVLHLVQAPAGGVEAAHAAALALAEPVLNAGPGQPPVIARSAWAGAGSPPRVAPEYGAVKLGFVHHTETPNGYPAGDVPAMLRAIYVFHRYVRGWNDIGYNFVVDLFGRIFEARAGGIDEPVVGAQAGGYNAVSSGVAVLGDFNFVNVSPPARHALERLLAWKLSLHGVPVTGRVTVHVDPAGAVYSRFPANAPVSLPRIAGHRDADSTDCPGDALYAQLPAVRRAASALAGQPASATLLVGAAPSPSPSPPPSPEAPGQEAPSPQAPSQEAPSPQEPGQEAPSPQAPSQSQEAPSPQEPGQEALPAGAEQRSVHGSLTLLDGSPVAGALVQVQARTVSDRGELVQEHTLASALTDAAGNWSVPVAIVHARAHGAAHSALRALCPGAKGIPAVVSQPLEVSGTITFLGVQPAAS